ncbi:hypothetical protein KVV02_008485 [Mortierella alpina]|uniref:N,O-diacetylmuramidase n=1 Tax=Mortierella alpina TaxID=64518 RepID=A0A9P8CXX6_MORAP|nr:hypothetical protein KVV02_008485 [Mortierella alpina]
MLKAAAILLCASVACCAQPKGIDVSGHQPNINWASVRANGIEFVYIKATEGNRYKSDQFSAQHAGATNTGLIRGAYHFALPDHSSGAAQANYFHDNGGGWSGDGRTLPGALDIEYNPYGPMCYGLSEAGMVKWIREFSDTYHARTSRYPVIYTTTDWWTQCTGNNNGFGANNPLWVARYRESVGTLPAGWKYHTIWQYTDKGPNPGDQNYFNGDSAGLQRFARG